MYTEWLRRFLIYFKKLLTSSAYGTRKNWVTLANVNDQYPGYIAWKQGEIATCCDEKICERS